MFKSWDLNWKWLPYVIIIFKSNLNSKEGCCLHSIYTILYSDNFVIYYRWIAMQQCCHAYFIICGYFTCRVEKRVHVNNLESHYSSSAPQSQFFPHIAWDCFFLQWRLTFRLRVIWTTLIITVFLNFPSWIFQCRIGFSSKRSSPKEAFEVTNIDNTTTRSNHACRRRENWYGEDRPLQWDGIYHCWW